MLQWEIINIRPSLGGFCSTGWGRSFDTAYSIMSIPVGLGTQNMEYLNQVHDKSLIESARTGHRYKVDNEVGLQIRTCLRMLLNVFTWGVKSFILTIPHQKSYFIIGEQLVKRRGYMCIYTNRFQLLSEMLVAYTNPNRFMGNFYPTELIVLAIFTKHFYMMKISHPMMLTS